MSWLFSQALVEEYSAGTSLAGQPCAQLNVMPTPHKFWRADKTIEPCDHSRFGLTSQLLTDAHGEELLTSFRAASLARTSAPRAPVQESKEVEAGYGAIWRGSLARYDHDACMWKTAQSSLLGDSEKFLETWPRWGSMLNGELFLRPTPVPRTKGSGSGFWQTPVADDAIERKAGKWNSRGEPKLSAEVKLWTTPSASDARRGGTITENMTGTSLAQQIKTPAFWPTPTAMNFTGGAALCKWGGAGARKKMATLVTPAEMNGQLNPQWVEWLMGWPIGWTCLKPLETAKFQEWQQQHGRFSANETI